MNKVLTSTMQDSKESTAVPAVPGRTGLCLLTMVSPTLQRRPLRTPAKLGQLQAILPSLQHALNDDIWAVIDLTHQRMCPL